MLTREPWFKLREVRLKIKINTKNINWCYNKKKKQLYANYCHSQSKF